MSCSRKWGIVIPFIRTHWFILLSGVIMIASSPGDGGYIRRYMFASWWGSALAYALNFAVDVTTEFLTYKLVQLWRGSLSRTRRILSLFLLLGVFALVGYAYIFSYRQFTLLLPTEPVLYRASLASFAPVVLTLLGGTKALTDTQARPKREKAKPLSTSERRTAVLARLREDAYLPQRALAAQFEVSRQVIGNDLRRLEAQGVIERGNGRGVTVL